LAALSRAGTNSARSGAAWMFTGTVGAMVVGAPGTIAIAALIGPSEKGMLATLIAVALIGAVVASLGLDSAIRYYLATKIWSLPQSNAVAIGLTIATGVIAFVAFQGTRAVAPHGLLTGLSSIELTAATATILLGMLAGQALLGLKEFRLFAWLSVISSLATIVLYFALVLCGASSLAAALWSWIGSQAAVAVPAQIALLRKGGWRLARPGDARGALSYGLRSFGFDLLNMANLRLDLLMLRSLSSVSYVGSYALAEQLTEVVWAGPNSVGTALYPEIAGGGHETGAWTARVCRLTSALAGIVALMVGLAATALIVVLLPRYRAAIPAVWLLLPGTAFAATLKILIQDLYARRQPQAALAAATVAVVVTVVGDLLLVPTFGATGAALVSSAAYIVGTLVLIRFFVSATRSRATALVPRLGDVDEAVRLAWRTAREFLLPKPGDEKA